MICVQVTYAQGLVKTFVADPECLLAEFAETVRGFGRMRSVRFQRDISEVEAALMVRDQQASRINSSRTWGERYGSEKES